MHYLILFSLLFLDKYVFIIILKLILTNFKVKDLIHFYINY